MAKRKGKMEESELAALLDGQISDAISFQDSELADARQRALEYYEGVMKDLPSEKGKSSVVSHDVADIIGWIMPGLMRVFLSAEHVAVYEPMKPNDEEGADQATDYVNYSFIRECDGYSQLRAAIFDGLLLGNGIVKHWWDPTSREETETYTGLSPEAYTMLLLDPKTMQPDKNVEIIEQSQRTDSMGLPVHDCKIKRTIPDGALKVKGLPPEEFLIARGETVLDETIRFCAHRSRPTRSELIEQGFDRDVVNDLPSYSGAEDAEKASRDRTSHWQEDGNYDKSTERVQIYECYPLCDYDGDGVAERRKVVIGDKASGSEERPVLSNDEWGDDLPFSDIVPDPVPHRWRGRSIWDETHDVMRIKTVLLRQTLDNIYRVNNPQRIAVENHISNMDVLVNQEIGGIVLAKTPDAVKDLVVPFMAKESFPVLEYMDQVIERRTGVSRSSMALDPEVLQNQTAAAVNATQSAAMSKVELYARNIAESGLRRLFRCLLRLNVKHQDRPKTIRLRDEWVQMDPRSWNAEMDAVINVGLGAGSRDRDILILQQVATAQRLLIEGLGPSNPVSSLRELRTTLAKIVEVAGLRSPEQYFREVSDEDMAALAQAKADPKMEEVKGKLALKQSEIAGNAQMKQAEMAGDMQQAQFEAMIDMRMDEMKAQMEAMLKVREQDIEAMLKRMEIQVQGAVGMRQAENVNTNIEGVKSGGSVG